LSKTAEDDPMLDIGPEDIYPGLDDGWPGDHCGACGRNEARCNCYGPECCCWCGQMFDGNVQAAVASGWRDLPMGLMCLDHDHDGDLPPSWMEIASEGRGVDPGAAVPSSASYAGPPGTTFTPPTSAGHAGVVESETMKVPHSYTNSRTRLARVVGVVSSAAGVLWWCACAAEVVSNNLWQHGSVTAVVVALLDTPATWLSLAGLVVLALADRAELRPDSPGYRYRRTVRTVLRSLARAEFRQRRRGLDGPIEAEELRSRMDKILVRYYTRA